MQRKQRKCENGEMKEKPDILGFSGIQTTL